MSFTKINAAGIGSTETITISGLSVVGDGSFGGNVSVAGTLTYEDVTNIDSVGLITARNGVVVGGGITLSKDGDGFFTGIVTATQLNVSGVSTLGEGIFLPDNKKAEFGNTSGNADLEIFHTGASSVIRTSSTATGGLNIRSEGDIVFGTTITPTDDYIKAIRDGAIELYYDGAKKLETTTDGVVVTGILTATSINVGSGITLSSDGNAFHTGIVTATSVTGVGTVTSVTASGIDLSGLLREGVKITAGKLSDNTNIDLENGMVHLFTTQETTTSTPNIRFSSSVTLNDVMQIGESIAVTIITTAAAAAYSADLNIDGDAVTENWVGGSAPSDGGSSGVDIHAYTIIKTANATFTVIANHSKTS